MTLWHLTVSGVAVLEVVLDPTESGLTVLEVATDLDFVLWDLDDSGVLVLDVPGLDVRF